jgi:hypothetical protein
MSNAEKILEEMKRLPPQMRFRSVMVLLTSRGWTLDAHGTSHYVARKERAKLTLPKKHGRYILRPYLKLVLDAIGETYEED